MLLRSGLFREPVMQAIRQGIFIAVVVAFCCFQSMFGAFSQVPAQALADPNELFSRLVFALQTGDTELLYGWLDSEVLKDVLRNTGQTGQDGRLVELGAVSAVETKPLPTDAGQRSFSALVTHQKGLTNWTVTIDDATHRVDSLNYRFLKPFDSASAGGGRGLARNPSSSGGHGGGGLERETAQRLAAEAARRAAEEAGRLQEAGSTRTSLPSPIPDSPSLDPRVVDFLYVTTRKPTNQSSSASISYSGERGTDLSFGAASVRIPKDHKIGRIELPVKWSLLGYTIYEGSLSDDKRFAIRKVAPLSPEQWGRLATARSFRKQALVFVHGYNTSFEDALYRNAQIIWDLQYPGLSVLFSWASAGNPADYFYDRDSAYLARDGFVKVLKFLRETYHFEKVDVIAHSMGNLVVLDALSSYARTSNPVKIGQLIMAAPDVDRDQFLQMEPDVRRITNGMTLYASSADKALVLSRVPARVPRAGDVPSEGPIVLPDMETIDVTAIGDEIFGLNHTEFASNRAIIDDIKLLISTGMRPPRLAQIRGIPDLPAIPKYWRYVP
jgi:esterase/lipase superfamily enzyme